MFFWFFLGYFEWCYVFWVKFFFVRFMYFNNILDYVDNFKLFFVIFRYKVNNLLYNFYIKGLGDRMLYIYYGFNWLFLKLVINICCKFVRVCSKFNSKYLVVLVFIL